MRISLLASTLFTVSLVGGVAFAEGPHATDKQRSHGDVVDKSYASVQHGQGAVHGVSGPTTAPYHHMKAPAKVDKSASRINCSDAGTECQSSAGAHAAGGAASSGSGGVSAHRAPPFMDKILGSDRTNFNEAGEDQGMSSRAVKRAWGSHGARGQSVSSGVASTPGAAQGNNEKNDGGGSGRMSCNEADECSMSNKDVKKIWAFSSAQAGTLPATREHTVTPAARRIAEQRAAEGATHAKQDGAGHEKAAGAAQADAH